MKGIKAFAAREGDKKLDIPQSISLSDGLKQKHRVVYRAQVLIGYLLRQEVRAVHLLTFAMFLWFLTYSRILISKGKKLSQIQMRSGTCLVINPAETSKRRPSFYKNKGIQDSFLMGAPSRKKKF